MPPDELTLDDGPGDARQGRSRATSRWASAPRPASRSSSRSGRFGPYVQRGTPEDDEKPQNASLLKGMEPEEVDLETALKLLSPAPRRWASIPRTASRSMAHNGRFGPYVKCGDETRSLPDDVSPLDVTLEQALELLAQPKSAARRPRDSRSRSRSSTPRRSPSEPVQLLDGRYGPYVTDGETNASLPRTMSPDEVTFERALDLLAERAAKGPARKKTAKKKAAKKTPRRKRPRRRPPKRRRPRRRRRRRVLPEDGRAIACRQSVGELPLHERRWPMASPPLDNALTSHERPHPGVFLAEDCAAWGRQAAGFSIR